MEPMLARLVRELPDDGYLFEPKWDGFRCLVTRDGGQVELESRHGGSLGRYFPELEAAFAGVPAERWTIDGEIVLVVDGRFDFTALMGGRLHPAASRVRALAARAGELRGLRPAGGRRRLAGRDRLCRAAAPARGAARAQAKCYLAAVQQPGALARIEMRCIWSSRFRRCGSIAPPMRTQ
ncbi:MAG: hypothetical protein JO168_21480 [Solirubrobacterales bacterium]|nr:hypothetical protein [Solirubrobacterales bacterium]MBV9714522.1 hypothetical protein [Solirubrobacterales bacterium]